jgi:hypothetical protein
MLLPLQGRYQGRITTQVKPITHLLTTHSLITLYQYHYGRMTHYRQCVYSAAAGAAAAAGAGASSRADLPP